MRVVRPELSGPRISEIAPRGKPSIKASSGARPVGSASWSRASERNPSVVERAAVGFMQIRLFFAICILLRGRESCQVEVVLGKVLFRALDFWVRFVIFGFESRPVTASNSCLEV